MPIDTRLPSIPAQRLRWRNGTAEHGVRDIPEETPIALVHDASTTAVMMATPADLEDFAIGFSLTEGIVQHMDELRGIEIVDDPLGMEVRMWLPPERSEQMMARRRRFAGPTGCGLCGIDSLLEAARTPKTVPAGWTISPGDIQATLAALSAAQSLGEVTRAVHAAGFWTPADGLVSAREDVGRHNALDKLAGALARSGVAAASGAVVLTSRVSVEMVQKTAAIGAPILIAVSAPTALAVRTAQAAGITLIAVARPDGFEVFAGEERVGG